MKISIDWLKEYLEADVPASELAETFNRIGLMVEGQEERDGDVIFEVETYSNRPDTLGHLGMAREVAAALGISLKERNWPLTELNVEASEIVDVQIWDEDLCPRYCGVVVKGVKVGPSPGWLRARIEAMGLNPVNNIVDISNFVLFSTAHPIHAFDLDRLAGAEVIIRRPKKGERLLCLDGTDLALAPDMLVIADENKPVALAGVIGGQESAVTEQTKDIFIESAYFDPVSVRRTRKAAGIQTDASYRFERGADIAFPPQAALMAASLLSQYGGRMAKGLVDVYPKPRKPKEIILRHRRIADLLGVELSEDFVQNILTRLEFGVEPQPGVVWRIKIPSFRVDIDREADLVEEIARFYGYENIPSELPSLTIVEPIPDRNREKIDKIKPPLLHRGLTEVINFSFSDPEKESALETGLRAVEIRNPISAKASLLRTTLLGGLLETAVWNRNRGLEAVHIFEVGNIYFQDEQECRERLALGLLSTGPLEEPDWNGNFRETNFFQLKGISEALMSQLRYEPFYFQPENRPFLEPGLALTLAYKEEKVGWLGRVADRTKSFFGLRQDVFAAEINLGLLFGKQPKAFVYSPVPKFPAVIRDISLLVPKSIAYQDLKKAIERVPLPILEGFQLVDRYVGESISEDKVGLSFRFIYRHPQRTLQAEDVDKAEQQILNQLRRAFNVQLRKGGKIDSRTGKN
jgi:phenylalanyl-tRNA synthetase beta chain